jgi:hypothetical protein
MFKKLMLAGTAAIATVMTTLPAAAWWGGWGFRGLGFGLGGFGFRGLGFGLGGFGFPYFGGFGFPYFGGCGLGSCGLGGMWW